ncbi:isopenicillin N synthase family oxygenase, partial [Francisella tularensis subsp. holarctica]|nr:isopenicillin N synthase family oxygenase [Francisella tularensis subsp. holarctica]
GFAVLRTHRIEWNLIQTVYKEWQEFLRSGAADKYIFDVENQDGYIPIDVSELAKGENVKDIKNFYHFNFQNGRYTTEIS